MLRDTHMVCMSQHTIQWKSTRQPNKTKAELREILAEAVRNTQAENKRLQHSKTDPSDKAA
jgi:hypothetical protein